MKRFNVLRLLAIVLVAIGLVIGYFGSRSTNVTAISPFAQVTQDRIVERALIIAHSRGFQDAQPEALAIKQTTLAEWNKLISFEPGPDAPKAGLDPNQPIVIVAIKGHVDWVGPGRRDGIGDIFDNITIAISPTGEHLGTYTVGPEQSLPLGLQR